jgi:hypothetical protein
MTHLLVIDYAYYTVKRFFPSIEMARAFVPESNLYVSYLKVLNTRLYELEKYTSPMIYKINFDIKLTL